MPVTRLDDTEARLSALMAAAQQGDRAAYADLLSRCVPLIGGLAGRRVRPDRLDDLVQEVLLSVHRARQTYDPARPFIAWLRAIVERRAIDLHRRAARHEAREVHAPLHYEQKADAAVPADTAIVRRQSAEGLRDAVANLPPNQREAIETVVLREYGLREAATLTGKTEGAIKVSLHRAIKGLRHVLVRKMDFDNA